MPRQKQRGGSLLELAVVGIVLGVLAFVLLQRLLRYQELAEKTVMETTVVNMRSGLRLKVAELTMRQRTDEIRHLVGQNPIDWLESPPPNYLGEIDDPARNPLPPGSWYYDKTSHELVYLPDRNRHLRPAADGRKIIRFHVTSTIQQAGKANGEALQSVTISPVMPYDWPVF